MRVAVRRLEAVGGELDQQAERVGEVDRVHEPAVLDAAVLDPALVEALDGLRERRLRDREREVVHAARVGRRALRVGRALLVGEDRDQAAVARIEVEVALAGVVEVRLLEDERHPEHALPEVDRRLPAGAGERDVVDALGLELAHRASSSASGAIGKHHVEYWLRGTPPTGPATGCPEPEQEQSHMPFPPSQPLPPARARRRAPDHAVRVARGLPEGPGADQMQLTGHREGGYDEGAAGPGGGAAQQGRVARPADRGHDADGREPGGRAAAGQLPALHGADERRGARRPWRPSRRAPHGRRPPAMSRSGCSRCSSSSASCCRCRCPAVTGTTT